MDNYNYIDRNGFEKTLDCDMLKSLAQANRRIQLIKEFRTVSGKGLKESKDEIDHYLGRGRINIEGLIESFKKAAGLPTTPDPYTKEEFMTLIETAVDNMESYHFIDMVHAVEVMLDNVKANGGLEALAKERDEFLRAI